MEIIRFMLILLRFFPKSKIIHRSMINKKHFLLAAFLLLHFALYAQKKNDCYLFVNAVNSSESGFSDFIPGVEPENGIHNIDTALLNVYEQLSFSFGWVSKSEHQISTVKPGLQFTEWHMLLSNKKIGSNGTPWEEAKGKFEEYFKGFCTTIQTSCMSQMKMTDVFHAEGYADDNGNEKFTSFIYHPLVELPASATPAEIENLLKGSPYLKFSFNKAFIGTLYYINLDFYGAAYE